MTELKTKVTKSSVKKFLDNIEDEEKRRDSYLLLNMMYKASKNVPRMWGESIIGFGSYHYVGKSGREGDWFLAGLSPRKQNLTLYVRGGWEHNKKLLAKLGKHSLGKGCLYIRRLEDVDVSILKKLIIEAMKHAKEQPQTDAKKQAKSKK